MAYGDRAGRVRVDPASPRGAGVCDYCGEWYNLHRLHEQLEYLGPSKKWLGFLVCDHCLDVCQAQNIPLILPPDPVPLKNPRVEFFTTNQNLAGFTQWQPFLPANAEQSESSILAAVATLSGVPTPAAYTDYSSTVAAQNVAQSLLPASSGRTWMLVYNPSNPQLAIGFGTVVWGLATNIILGPGQAVLASGSGINTGALSCIGQIPGVAYNAWSAPT